MWVNKVKLDGDFHKLGFKEGFLCVAYKYDFKRPVMWWDTLTDWIVLSMMVDMLIDCLRLNSPVLGAWCYAVGAGVGLKLYWDHLKCAEWRLLQMLRRMS